MKKITLKFSIKPAQYLFSFLVFILTAICYLPHNIVGLQQSPGISGSYLGQKSSGMKPEIFAPGIISTDALEMCISFVPGGKELYFVRKSGTRRSVFFMKEKNGRWTAPEITPFSGKYEDAEFSLSPDGNKLALISLRPLEENGQPLKFWDIWVVDRTGTEWGKPVNPGNPINSDKREVFPALSKNGDLYFSSDRDGGWNIYVSKFVDGHYNPPEKLSTAINSEYGDWDQAIAPDDSYMIFCSIGRPDSYGGSDLYISFRKKDGTWTKATNMGKDINTSRGVMCPTISPDGKYVFFASSISGNGDIYWVDAKIIEELKPAELK